MKEVAWQFTIRGSRFRPFKPCELCCFVRTSSASEPPPNQSILNLRQKNQKYCAHYTFTKIVSFVMCNVESLNKIRLLVWVKNNDNKIYSRRHGARQRPHLFKRAVDYSVSAQCHHHYYIRVCERGKPSSWFIACGYHISVTVTFIIYNKQ